MQFNYIVKICNRFCCNLQYKRHQINRFECWKQDLKKQIKIEALYNINDFYYYFQN